MGHIVTAKQLENIEKISCQVSSVPSTPSTPPFREGAQTAVPQHIAQFRRFHSYAVGSTWSECVQSVSNLLPSPYAERWLKCLTVLHNEGPLRESWRIYIAILALCRHEVTWAVRALTIEFISAHGERKWLSGLRFAPSKIQALKTINNILAHRPWLLTPEHIHDLTKGEESWSISELCHALCLITHFHSFASFLHVCLPHPNPPQHSQSTPPPPPPPPPRPHALSSSEPNSLPLTPRASPARIVLPSSLPDKFSSEDLPGAESRETTERREDSECISVSTSGDSSAMDTQMKTSTDTCTTISSVTCTTEATVSVANQPGAMNQQLLCKTKVGVNGAVGGAKREIQASSQPNKQSKNESHSTHFAARKEEAPSYSLREFPHLCHDLAYVYDKLPSPWTFKILEFNWQDHGFCLLRSVWAEMAAAVDERFGAVKNVAHPSWGANQEGGGYLFRRAVWSYIQSLYGILDESYTYKHISSYLNQEVQEFIKTCCCWPERLEGKIPLQLLQTADNLPSQLVPLSILIMEARTESGLLYAFRAVAPHR